MYVLTLLWINIWGEWRLNKWGEYGQQTYAWVSSLFTLIISLWYSWLEGDGGVSGMQDEQALCVLRFCWEAFLLTMRIENSEKKKNNCVLVRLMSLVTSTVAIERNWARHCLFTVCYPNLTSLNWHDPQWSSAPQMPSAARYFVWR